jgi:hypothetical protein
MTEVVDISAEYELQIRDTVRRDIRGRRTSVDGRPTSPRQQPSLFPEFAVILDADLPAASHSLTGATHCLATICRWSTSQRKYVETAKQIEVWNHGEATAHAVNTFGLARNIDGHYWFFGDCEPMADREGS